MTDQLPPPTVSDALRDLGRMLDDYELADPTHIGIRDDGTIFATVPSDGFDSWRTSVVQAGSTRSSKDPQSGVTYLSARVSLCRGQVAVTVHAFDVPQPEVEKAAS